MNITHSLTNNMCVLEYTCDFDPSTRSDCGCPGVNEAICVENGCCWDNTVWGVPWCYQKRSTCKYRYCFHDHCYMQEQR